jgi:hypothetical protein
MNPYLVQFLDLVEQHKAGSYMWSDCKITGKDICYCAYEARHALCNKYSFAIPNDEAIEKIASFGKILEIGAGTGYWASLIREAGAEVGAIDLAPVGGPWKNEWAFNQKHYPVVQGDGWRWVEVFTPEYTPMLCWPPMDRTAADCLNVSNSEYFIYIGEGYGGCTADDDFFDLLDGTYFRGPKKDSGKWTIEDYISIPQWPGIHDGLYILKRK